MPDPNLIVELIAKHLPPSAERVRVQALDDRARMWLDVLQSEYQVVSCDANECDASLATNLVLLSKSTLRAGGRAIFLLADETRSLSELSALLQEAGLIHILVEQVLEGAFILARGERSPIDVDSKDRIARVAAPSDDLTILPGDQLPRYLHLLVHQEPPSRAWEQLRLDAITWDALTLRDTSSKETLLLGFSSLTKAVAFMQAAVLANVVSHVNKMPRYRGETVAEWNLRVLLNPAFDTLHEASRYSLESLPLRVDPRLEDKIRE